MARTEARIGLIAETLLTASSARERSLQGIDTDGLIEGTSCYIAEDGSVYRFRPDDTNTPNNTTIVAAAGAAGGNWSLAAGRSIVEVRSVADLVETAATTYRLTQGTEYRIVGDIDLGDHRLYMQGGDISIVGMPGSSRLTSSHTDGVIRGNLITAPVELHGLELVNTGAGPGVYLDFDALANLVVANCDLSGGDGLFMNGVDELRLMGTRFTATSSGGAGVFVSGALPRLRALDCYFYAADGEGMHLGCGASGLGVAEVVGCAFNCSGVANNTIDMPIPTAVATGATLTGCTFEGTAIIPGTNITAGNGWVARGNVSFADFG